MKKIGLTGGLGSGKSTVAAIFELLGIPVYYADDAAKRLMNDDAELKTKIKNAFGEKAYVNGVLDTKFVAARVFNNPGKLNLLNSLVHPATLKDASDWMNKQHAPYVIKEAALIFESGAAKDLDFVIGVAAPPELRIKRAMQRDHASREEVMARISRQMAEDEKLRLCKYVIVNDEQQMILPQVLHLHGKFLNSEG
ncbi:MAG TPA: dephospho-CoA kinase [Chitinophagaceae bacterium]|nr:dephospho-CoA kinase [Chitinophagaceae bacterium]